MTKRVIPFMILPLFLFGCGKNKNVYASSKNTIFSFKLEGDNAIITGLNDNYKNQTELIIPYSIDKHVVKRIEDNSFDGVHRIKNVDITKSNLEEIGASAFKKCSNLVEVKYNDTLTTIKENAFEECKNLEKMDLSNSKLEVASDNMFLKCESLKTVVFPATLKKIGSNIFSECDNITELDYTDLNIEEIGDYAFSGLSNLKDVKLSKTTKTIGAYAFSNNKKIQYLKLSDTSIEKIGEGAFSNCTILINVTLPQTLKELGNKAFYYCSKLSKLDISKTKVEVIPDSCFELCRAFDSISLPNLKTISSRAFYNSALRTINVPSATTDIADDAFRLCNKLESISVSNDNENYVVVNNALYTYNKEKLIVYPAACTDKEFVISQNTITINPYAFSDAINLEKVDLQSIKISEIGGYTFMNCTSLKEVKIGTDEATGIKKIGVKAFFGCKSLESFDGQHSLTEIGESAFYDCIGLKSLYLGESTLLTKIDSEAFYNCNKLEYLSLPGSLTTVGRAAFYNCVNVETFNYGANKSSFEELIRKNPDSGLDQFKDLLS